MLPVTLNLQGRSCLVVGGGEVALRKIRSLLTEGAEVTVVAPETSPAVEDLARSGRIRLERRPYREGEASAYALVFAATSRREVNRRVFEDGDRARIWANVADDPELCSFHLAARVRRGPLDLAVGSGGRAPFAARRLRELLDRRLGEEWIAWGEAAARYRSAVRQCPLSPAEREARFDRFFQETVDPEALTVRLPSAAEVEAWLSGRPAPGPAPEEPRVGRVSLVGAGPGCPGLLTLRGRQRLLAADAVLYDRLAAPALPCDLPERVELYGVGKEAGSHHVPQEEIIALLLRLAGEGKSVVRLKGGDPYVFGRGGEEAEALAAAGIPFEVVPGVTSGIAAASWIGVPVTHRGEATRVSLVTAHASRESGPEQVRWDLLAQDPHATLLGYMSLATLPTVVRQLLEAGMPPDTPAAMVQHGTTAAQRSVVSTLSALPGDVEREGLLSPALFVVGPTVRRADRLDWVARQALAGERLVVPPGASGLAATLEAAGAEVIAVGLPLTPAARVVIRALPLTGCVAGSASDVEALSREPGLGGPTAWCLGTEAAGAARKCRWARVEEVEAGPNGWGLVERIAKARRAAR